MWTGWHPASRGDIETSWCGLLQYTTRCVIVWPHTVLKLRDYVSELSYRFEIWLIIFCRNATLMSAKFQSNLDQVVLLRYLVWYYMRILKQHTGYLHEDEIYEQSFRTMSRLCGNPLLWRHNERDGVSNHQPRDCLLGRLFRRRSKYTPKLRVTGRCEGNSPVTSEFSAQRASNAENVSIWWRHHAFWESLRLIRRLIRRSRNVSGEGLGIEIVYSS